MKEESVVRYNGVRNVLWVGGYIISAESPDAWCLLLADISGLSADQLIAARDRLAKNRPWIAWVETPNASPSPVYRCQARTELGAKREAYRKFRSGCQDDTIVLAWKYPFNPESKIDPVATRRIGGNRWEYIQTYSTPSEETTPPLGRSFEIEAVTREDRSKAGQ